MNPIKENGLKAAGIQVARSVIQTMVFMIPAVMEGASSLLTSLAGLSELESPNP